MLFNLNPSLSIISINFDMPYKKQLLKNRILGVREQTKSTNFANTFKKKILSFLFTRRI